MTIHEINVIVDCFFKDAYENMCVRLFCYKIDLNMLPESIASYTGDTIPKVNEYAKEASLRSLIKEPNSDERTFIENFNRIGYIIQPETQKERLKRFIKMSEGIVNRTKLKRDIYKLKMNYDK